MIVDSEFLENLSQYPEAGYEVIQRFIRDSLDASVPPRRRRALNLVDFPISQKSSDQNVLQRSELRQSESKNLEREPGEIQNDILKLNERIVTEMERMSLRALQTRDMKENREARSLYKTFNNMTKKTLRDHYAGLEDLEFAKRQLESFMASRFRPATFEKADRKKTPLDVLDNHLGNLIKNRENIDEFYQELGNNRYARFSGNVENHAILDYIRTTSAVWMIDFRRFIDTIPEQQGDFRERLVSFLTPLGAWFLKPADIPVLKEQRPEYVAAILNKLHKYERTASGEIISRPLEAQDMIGANHRREIFHLAEGLDFMIEASKNLKFSQSELPLFRSEMRVVGTEAFKTSLSKTVSLVDSLPVSSEIIFAAEHMGTYSAEDIAAELEGGITEDNVRKSRLWITMKLLETMSSARQEGKITNKRLQQFLDEVMASVPDMVRAAISRNTVDGPKFHVNLKGLDERQWSEFIRDFPVVLGMLVTLHASLSINVDAEGEALQSIKKKFNDLMTQEGITLTSGQLHIVSATGRNPFPSFNGREKANAFMARDKNLLLRRKNVLSYWITEDEGHMAQLTAGIATALLEVVSDAHLNAANTYKPSDYATLLATVINAIQGYLQIQVAA